MPENRDRADDAFDHTDTHLRTNKVSVTKLLLDGCFGLSCGETGDFHRTNERNREGSARTDFAHDVEIRLTEEGTAHPLYRGKPRTFAAFTSHADEVSLLAPGAMLLASNPWSRVQASCSDGGSGSFWAVQYHPEYDCHEVASLCRLRKPELVAQGTFENEAAADRNIELLEQLHEKPDDVEAAAALDVDDTVLDPDIRTREVRNWLDQRARLTAATR